MKFALRCLALGIFCCGGPGCGGSEARDPAGVREGAAGDGADVAGGTTGDFTGDMEICSAERTETLADEPVLGFSLADLLATGAGDFVIPIRWESRCSAQENAGAAACADEGAPFRALDGADTTVTISVAHGGEPATVRHPTEAEPLCAQEISVPVSIRLSSSDGVLDESWDAALGSGCGDQVAFGFRRPVATLEGGLGEQSMGFPSSHHVEFTAGFFGDRMWVDLHVVDPNTFSVFSIDLPPFGVQTHDVARSEVEQQPGAALSGEHCEPSGSGGVVD